MPLVGLAASHSKEEQLGVLGTAKKRKREKKRKKECR